MHGKNSKDRIVPLSEKTNLLLKSYIDKEGLSRPESKDKLLFLNHSREKLTRAGVAYILKKYIKIARSEQPDIIPEKFSPHCMRHSKAMHLLQAGVQLIYIRDFLGHESIKTTEVYAKADSKSKRDALEIARSAIDAPELGLTASWNDDASLMKFLDELCGK